MASADNTAPWRSSTNKSTDKEDLKQRQFFPRKSNEALALNHQNNGFFQRKNQCHEPAWEGE